MIKLNSVSSCEIQDKIIFIAIPRGTNKTNIFAIVSFSVVIFSHFAGDSRYELTSLCENDLQNVKHIPHSTKMFMYINYTKMYMYINYNCSTRSWYCAFSQFCESRQSVVSIILQDLLMIEQQVSVNVAKK